MAKQISNLAIIFSRLKTLTYIIKVCIWGVIISIDNAKIVLTQLVSQTTNAFFLQPCFSRIGSTFAGSNIRSKLKVMVPPFVLEINLKLFFAKVLENPSFL